MSWCELLLVTVSQTQGLWEKHIKALQQDPMHDSIDLRLVDTVSSLIYTGLISRFPWSCYHSEMGLPPSPTAVATTSSPGTSPAQHGLMGDELELVYDPDLNCFYDPNTGKYYELTQ